MYRSVVVCIDAVFAVVVAIFRVSVVNGNCVLRWFVVDLSVNPRACFFILTVVSVTFCVLVWRQKSRVPRPFFPRVHRC